MTDFLSPVSKAVLAHRELLPENSLGAKMRIHSPGIAFPDLSGCELAIIGVQENRRSTDFVGRAVSFDNIRKALYGLYPGSWHVQLADLGDIMPGESVEDTYFALRQVVLELHQQNIIPIILGGSQDLVYANYRAYDDRGAMVNMVNVDSRFDLGDADLPISNTSYIGKMVVDKPYNLFNYANIGYQTYFNSADEIDLIERLYFEAYRLGSVAADISSVEPIMRDADIVAIDISAIKSTELTHDYGYMPNGFDGREICAIARYAGISNRVSSFGIYELEGNREAERAAMLIAQMVWYFAEGVNYRIDDGNFTNESEYLTYTVPVEDQTLRFKKSKKTGRWWIELPFISNVNNKLKRHTLLPCTYRDYEDACNQKIPERWYKARRKNEV
ncbi:formimidoylglutamase [Gilvibacter sp.]|uniref:formimidoylglutamase n=1 Tax=Gilvibacter sp. TaxID=2729997 RepID=UPI003F49E250